MRSTRISSIVLNKLKQSCVASKQTKTCFCQFYHQTHSNLREGFLNCCLVFKRLFILKVYQVLLTNFQTVFHLLFCILVYDRCCLYVSIHVHSNVTTAVSSSAFYKLSPNTFHQSIVNFLPPSWRNDPDVFVTGSFFMSALNTKYDNLISDHICWLVQSNHICKSKHSVHIN
jgi:hypothetical protein